MASENQQLDELLHIDPTSQLHHYKVPNEVGLLRVPIFHGRTSIPHVDWHDEKREAVKELTKDLLEATQIPTLEQTLHNLDLLQLPTRKLFYDYGSLLDKKFLCKFYPEFLSLKPGKTIPDEIGPYKIDPHYQFLNERHYIIPILEKASNEGYDIAKVTNKGIYFIVKEQDLPESIKINYQRFFMSNDQVLYQIEQVIQTLLKNNKQHVKSFTDIYRLRINGEQFNHIRITYPDALTRYEINQMRLELSSHYKNMGYQIKFFYDRNLEDNILPGANQPEPTVLKIFFNLQDVVPKIREHIINNVEIKKSIPVIPYQQVSITSNELVTPNGQGFINGFITPNGINTKSINLLIPSQPEYELDLDSNDFLLDDN